MDTDKKIARSDYYSLFKINLSENLCQLKQVLILCRSASKLEANWVAYDIPNIPHNRLQGDVLYTQEVTDHLPAEGQACQWKLLGQVLFSRISLETSWIAQYK